MALPTTSIRKHTNELRVPEKTVRTSQDFNPLDDAKWVVLENKTNLTSQ